MKVFLTSEIKLFKVMSPFLLGSTQMSQSVSILILCLSRNLKYEMCPGEKTEVEKKQSFGSSSIILNELVGSTIGQEDPLDKGMATHSSYSCLENPMDTGA